MNVAQPVRPTVEPGPSLGRFTHVIYALHAFSLVTGIIGAATVVGAFLTGWPSIIAVVLNYVKRSEARGTWLESHFRWQIRTFWFGLLWVSLCLLFVLVTFGIGLKPMVEQRPFWPEGETIAEGMRKAGIPGQHSTRRPRRHVLPETAVRHGACVGSFQAQSRR